MGKLETEKNANVESLNRSEMRNSFFDSIATDARCIGCAEEFLLATQHLQFTHSQEVTNVQLLNEFRYLAFPLCV